MRVSKFPKALLIFGVLCSTALFAATPTHIALVLDRGGKDDKSFNAAAYRGATEAQDKLKVQLKYVETMDEAAQESALRSFAQKDYDLIIAIGIGQAQSLQKVATQFPKKKFAIVDAKVDLPNVRSLLFSEHEGSYLVGAAAALASKTGKISFIGGMKIPMMDRFAMGYEAGAKKINPKIKVSNAILGVTSEAWNNPTKCKEISLQQYDAGSDVIFAAAGASGAGTFDAAEERKKLVIGVDSNQNFIKPGYVLTSMLKRVDVAVFDTIKSLDHFTSGVKIYNLANNGVDFALDQYNKDLIKPAMLTTLNQIKKDIIAGKIVVPDYYKK